MTPISRRDLLFGALGVLIGGATPKPTSAGGPVTTDQYGDQNQTLPRWELPAFAKSGGPKVEEAYRFALG